MPIWTWIALGIGSFTLVSVLVGFALGPVLGRISRETDYLYEGQAWESFEAEAWASAPPTRASAAEPEAEERKAETKSGRVVRLR